MQAQTIKAMRIMYTKKNIFITAVKFYRKWNVELCNHMITILIQIAKFIFSLSVQSVLNFYRKLQELEMSEILSVCLVKPHLFY